MFPFPEGKEYLNLIPIDSMEEFYMPLYAFDFSKDSKNGCGGSKSETVLKFHLITNIQTMFIFSTSGLTVLFVVIVTLDDVGTL